MLTIGEAIENTKQPGVPLVTAEREWAVGVHGCWCYESFACNAEKEI
jgi:G:T-mismatch repair DNA endonuclease (very short patch repair protein)